MWKAELLNKFIFQFMMASYPVLSQGSMGNLPVIENKEAFKFNISYEEQKLFRT